MRKTIYTVLFFIIAACAVSKPPTGGPEDKTPPRIVEFHPTPGSAGVPGDTGIRMTFSEKLDGDSFKDRIATYPPIGFKSLKVKGERLDVVFERQLPETTITILLKAGFKDNHLVGNSENFIFHFATSDSIEKGEISGIILFKNKPDSTGVAELFEIKADTIIDVNKQAESRIAFAGDGGQFYFRALPADGSRYLLWTFLDKNGDAKYSAETEFSALYPDTIVLTDISYRSDELMINIIDPHEPGSIEGRVINETGFKAVPFLRLEPILPGEKALVGKADTTGNFILAPVPPGGYILSSFIDIEADSTCGSYTPPEDTSLTLKEPCYTSPDTLIMIPGESKILEPFTLEKGEDDKEQD